MKKLFASIFNTREEKKPEYKGLSDFFLYASPAEKKKVIIEAAHRANEDQLKIYNEARLKIKTN